MKILGDNMTWAIIWVGGGGGGFESILIGHRKEEDNLKMEKQQITREKYSINWHKHKLTRTPEDFYLTSMNMLAMV